MVSRKKKKRQVNPDPHIGHPHPHSHQSNLSETMRALLPPLTSNKESLPKDIQRFWYRRRNLFSLFDSGIRMDETGWFSVTPEAFAIHIAERCRCDSVADLFAGVGGNVIQFAATCEIVYAVEIDPVRMACSIHNASIYQVDSRIEFILSDALTWVEQTRLLPDVIFLSPPWGGPAYLELEEYSPMEHMPIDWERLLHACFKKTPNLAMYLPKNLSWAAIQAIADLGIDVEVEEMYAYNGARLVTLYTGSLVRCPELAYQQAG